MAWRNSRKVMDVYLPERSPRHSPRRGNKPMNSTVSTADQPVLIVETLYQIIVTAVPRVKGPNGDDGYKRDRLVAKRLQHSRDVGAEPFCSKLRQRCGCRRRGVCD